MDVDLSRVTPRPHRTACAAIVLLLAAQELHAVNEHSKNGYSDHHWWSTRLRHADGRRLQRIRVRAYIHLVGAVAEVGHRSGRRAARLRFHGKGIRASRSQQVAVFIAW